MGWWGNRPPSEVESKTDRRVLETSLRFASEIMKHPPSPLRKVGSTCPESASTNFSEHRLNEVKLPRNRHYSWLVRTVG